MARALEVVKVRIASEFCLRQYKLASSSCHNSHCANKARKVETQLPPVIVNYFHLSKKKHLYQTSKRVKERDFTYQRVTDFYN